MEVHHHGPLPLAHPGAGVVVVHVPVGGGVFLSPGTRHPSFRASRPTVPSKFIHLRVHPGQHIRVVSLRRKLFDRTPITRAPIRGRPLKHAKVPVGRRRPARILVPRAAVRASLLQHLEMPAPRRLRARLLIPRAAVRAQHLQLFELSAPRSCRTKVFLTRQAPSPLKALHRA